jgi:hypothetical protein
VIENNTSSEHTVPMFRVRELLATEKEGTLIMEILVFECDGLLGEGTNTIKNRKGNVGTK